MTSIKKIFSLALASCIFFPCLSACTQSPQPAEDPDSSSTLPAEHDYSVAFSQSELLLAVKENYHQATISVSATCDGEAMENAAITYESKSPAVATVSPDGTITALSAGETEITATIKDGETAVSDTLHVSVLASATEDEVNTLDEQYVNIFGRTYISSKRLVFDNVCTGIEISFIGTKLTGTFSASSDSKLRIFTDGDTEGVAQMIKSTKTELTLCEGLTEGIHTVRILKAASPIYGKIYIPQPSAFSTDGEFLAAKEKSDFKIEFIGDSITAGCGAIGTSAESQQTIANSDPTKAYAYLTAQALNADFSIMALEGICVKDGTVNSYNAYMQYSTNYTAAYDPAVFDASVVVLALAENDMWHATSSSFSYTVDEFRKDYADMLRLIREKHPNAKIVCIYGMMPASSTVQTAQTIQDAINDTEDTNITSLAMTSNETGANFHPNAEIHKFNAQKLVKHIQGLFE